MKGQYVRGLVKFITDIRNLRTDYEKEFRIKEEIAKIRVSFSTPRLTEYDKKKNLLKLLYVQMLGYDIDLGYLEAVQLMASSKLADKATGYMGCEILLRDYEDVMRLCINTTIEDLNNPCEHVCSLALTFIANSHSLEMNERLSNEVIKLSMRFTSDNTFLRKKLYMCLLRTYKLNPQLYELNEWFNMVYHILETEGSVTCLLSICNLLDPILRQKPKNWELSIERLVTFLWEIANDNVPVEHTYFSIPAPWLTIKILSILSSIPALPNLEFMHLFSNCLKVLLDKTSNLVLTRLGHKESNRANKLMNLSIYMTKTGILRETIRAVVNWFPHLENITPQYICNCIRHLYTSVMSQIRLVALEIIEDVIKIKETFEYIQSDAEFIIHFLNDSDPTIKKRCCLILCGLCDITNWEFIVPELISTLRYSEISIQEYMVPLICNTIDRHLPKNNLYIDLIFKIIVHAPLASNNAISLLLLSTLYKENSLKFQEKVVEKCLYYMKDDAEMTEGLLRICAYVLGDYGYLSKEVGMNEQLKLLEKYFVIASSESKCVLVTTFGKFASRDNSLAKHVETLLEKHVNAADVNLQTRTCELLKLLRTNMAVFNKVLKILSETKPTPRDSQRSLPSRDSNRLRDSPRRESSARESFESGRESYRNGHRDHTANGRHREERAERERRPESGKESERQAREGHKGSTPREPVMAEASGKGLFGNEPCALLVTNYVKVELEQAYRNQQSKVLVRVTNVANEVLHVHRCNLKAPPELQGQEHNQLKELGLRPGQSAAHKLSFMLLEEVLELPRYVVEFSPDSDPEPVKHVLELPVAAHKFMAPIALDPGSFTRHWNALVQTQPFALRFNSNLGALADSLKLLNFDVVEAGDNLYCSGAGVKSTESSEFVVLGMFTLDKKGALVVSIRASSGVLAQCVINSTKTLLKQL